MEIETRIIMKKKILCAILFICIVITAGCGIKENKENITTVDEKTIGDELSIESGNEMDDDITEESEEGLSGNTTEVEENVDFVCVSGNEDVDRRVEEIVELIDDNEKIESTEWVEENRCYRVKIRYIDTPEGEYEHKRDYFFYVDNEIGAIVVTYPSSDEVGACRYVYGACDFEAKLEDVNFDGLDDLVIFLGHAGAQGAMVHCVYLNYGGVFAYNASFEQIPNYQIDKDNNMIIGSYRRDANTYVECSYKYDYETNAFVLGEENVME